MDSCMTHSSATAIGDKLSPSALTILGKKVEFMQLPLRVDWWTCWLLHVEVQPRRKGWVIHGLFMSLVSHGAFRGDSKELDEGEVGILLVDTCWFSSRAQRLELETYCFVHLTDDCGYRIGSCVNRPKSSGNTTMIYTAGWQPSTWMSSSRKSLIDSLVLAQLKMYDWRWYNQLIKVCRS
jgi:hypothetical protein